MPIILDKQLYEQVRRKADEIYKKPSAYKSGWIVKHYKELGGRYGDDNKPKNLERWFKEEWGDIGGLDYPVYRPFKRITKDTPLTAFEIDPKQAKKQIALKQEIRGERNLPPFLAKGNGIKNNINPIHMKSELKKQIEMYEQIFKHLKGHIQEGNYDDLDIRQFKLLEKEIERLKHLKKGLGAIMQKTLIPAVKIDKNDDIWEYSNPIDAQKKAFKYLGENGNIYRSVKKDKKYVIYNPIKDEWVNFGQMGYQDLTKHRDKDKMRRYRARAENMKGEWRDDPYSANNLSINILW